jgi:hypothetical protein
MSVQDECEGHLTSYGSKWTNETAWQYAYMKISNYFCISF